MQICSYKWEERPAWKWVVDRELHKGKINKTISCLVNCKTTSTKVKCHTSHIHYRNYRYEQSSQKIPCKSIPTHLYTQPHSSRSSWSSTVPELWPICLTYEYWNMNWYLYQSLDSGQWRSLYAQEMTPHVGTPHPKLYHTAITIH